VSAACSSPPANAKPNNITALYGMAELQEKAGSEVDLNPVNSNVRTSTCHGHIPALDHE
jgi:hypothetical protein